MKFIIDKDLIYKPNEYLEIKRMVDDPSVNLETDNNFKTMYCDFYFPSPVSPKFKKEYFGYMQQYRNNPPTFEEAINEIYKRTGEVHYSFASKLVHTLNNDSPILDQHVLRLMGFQINKSKNAKKKIDYYCTIYNTIKDEYLQYKNTNYMIKCIKQFDTMYPTYSDVSYFKKIDCLIFRLRDERITSILELTDKDSK